MYTDAVDRINAYNYYLDNHIRNVKTGFEWLMSYMPELFEDCDGNTIYKIRNNIINHDKSKYGVEEFMPYVEYFYGDNGRTKEVMEEFDLAWLHHQNINPHHWQYWILYKDDGGSKALEMPFEYIIEMICDWWAFSWSKNNLYEIFDWYEENKHKMLLHPNTLTTVEDILKQLDLRVREVENG